MSAIKSDHIDIDAIDIAIIDLLQQDGRMSATDISRHLKGVTARVARYRIEQLVQQGVISVVAVVHPEVLGYVVKADILLEVDPDCIDSTMNHIVDLECVRYASTAAGDRDISIQVIACSVDDLYETVVPQIRTIPGVHHALVYVLPHPAKYTYGWKVPRQGRQPVIPQEEPADRDGSRPRSRRMHRTAGRSGARL